MSPAGLREIAESIGFSGVARLERPDGGGFELARGQADRRHGVPIGITTRFATASATKGFTALTVMSLVESGALTSARPLRSVVGDALPCVDPEVTIEHLLGHTSGVGDYLDEETLGDVDDHVIDVSMHTLARPSDYLDLLNEHPQVARPGGRFAYNNSGYVMLALVVEGLTGSYHEAVADRVLAPAGMLRSGFFRSDDLPPDTALGYLENGRTNVFHLPVIGGGDGGIYLTLDDVTAFWDALDAGRIVSPAHVAAMTTPRRPAGEGRAYGLGFWTSPDGSVVWLEGMDAGVSFVSSVDRSTGVRATVMANTSSGAWPLARHLEALPG